MNILEEAEHKVMNAFRMAQLKELPLPEFVILDYETYKSIVKEDMGRRYYYHAYTKENPESEGDTFCGLKVSVLMNIKIKTIEVR